MPAQTIKLNDFTGHNNRLEDYEVGWRGATAINVDFTKTRKIERRHGYSRFMSGNVLGCWGDGRNFFYQIGNSLYELLPDLSVRNLNYSVLTPSSPYSGVRVVDRIFLTNGKQNICIRDGYARTWGLTPPQRNFSIEANSEGVLQPGSYQVGLAFVRSDGQVSGVRQARSVSLTEVGGIYLSGIQESSDPDVVFIRIYITPTNGTELFEVGEIAYNETSFQISVDPSNVKCQFQFFTAPPVGENLCYYRGRIYISSGNMLFYTEQYNPEICSEYGFIPFSSKIMGIGDVSDGLYVACEDDIWYLRGSSPSDFNIIQVAKFGAIPYSTVGFDANALDNNPVRDDAAGRGPAVAMMTKKGLCSGFDGGRFYNFTYNEFWPNKPIEYGASVAIDNQGQLKYVMTAKYDSTAIDKVYFGKSDQTLLTGISDIQNLSNERSVRLGKPINLSASTDKYVWYCRPQYSGLANGFIDNITGSELSFANPIVVDGFLCYRSSSTVDSEVSIEVIT